MRVGIIGAGITGLFIAYYLKREGIKEITIFEKGKVGEGSVHAAGLIEPFRFDKINSNSMIIKMIKYSLNGNTLIKEFDKKWLEELIKSLNKDPPLDAWERVNWMARFSLREYKRFAEEKNDFDYSESGIAEVYKSYAELERGIEEEEKSPFKPKFEIVEIKGFAGGIYFPELAKLNTEKFINRIKTELNNNINIINKTVVNVTREGKVHIEDGKIYEFDEIVVSAGIWCRRYVPVTSFKGYGIYVKGSEIKLDYPVVLAELGIAIVKNSDHVKLTFGFDADFSTKIRDYSYVLKNSSKLVKIEEILEIKLGFRPCSPDGFPIIAKKENMTIATGACRLGWSFAPAIGKMATDLVLNRVKDYGYLSRYF
ncbi:MAG: FAD-binding oxidoreductase [Sulfolobaceae archaeon]